MQGAGGAPTYARNDAAAIFDVVAPSIEPALTLSAEVSPSFAAPGAIVTITAFVINEGGGLDDAMVATEVHDAFGQIVGQRHDNDVSIGAGRSARFTYAWAAPPEAGRYTVKLGAFGNNGGRMYAWSDAAASIVVTEPPAPPPLGEAPDFPGRLPSMRVHFDDGLHGWRGVGPIFATLAASTLRASALDRSLAVSSTAWSQGAGRVSVSLPDGASERTLIYRVWIPSVSLVAGVYVSVDAGEGSEGPRTSSYRSSASLTPGAWNTLSVTLPESASALGRTGVQFLIGLPAARAVYVESVTW
jgi:hypothetical protein